MSEWIKIQGQEIAVGSYLIVLQNSRGDQSIMRKRYMKSGWTMKRIEYGSTVTHYMSLPALLESIK